MGIEQRNKMVKLFVYGTLKTGFALNGYLRGARLISEDKLKGYDIYSNGSFPMIKKGTGKVKGEIFEIPIKLFETLDIVESGYTRTLLNTEHHTGIYVYVYNHSVSHLRKLKEVFV